jgi:hypothetical protein
MTNDRFTQALRRIFDWAQANELNEVDVRAGKLHRSVGGYPGPDHRMPACCSSMIREMGLKDRIVCQPPKGKGASLTVRYKLPRAASL